MASTVSSSRSGLTFTHAKKTVMLRTQAGRQQTLSEMVKDVTPACHLNPFLFNGHVQTCWTAWSPTGPHIHYKRRVFSAEDPRFGGHFAADFVVAASRHETTPHADDVGLKEGELQDDPTGVGHLELPPQTTYFTNGQFQALASTDSKPLLIVLHGLSGGSYEAYLRHVLAPLVTQTPEGERAGGLTTGDWEAIVVNSRGCAGSKITTGILYNARATWDIRQVIRYCRVTWPNRPLFAIGFSLGANILTNYLGEEGSTCVLRAAMIVASPWKLESSSIALQRSAIGLQVYSRAMGSNMKRVIRNHRNSIAENTSLDLSAIEQVTYLHEFDREVQCPTWGYPTEGAYYRDASSADAVLAIRVPTFCLHARDDPIASIEAVAHEEIRQNPFVVMCSTTGGGHLGWFELGGTRWHPKPASAFLNAMRKIDSWVTLDPINDGNVTRSEKEAPFRFQPTARKLEPLDLAVARREDVS